MTSPPKISVIIPTLNDFPYIQASLESVFAQTFSDIFFAEDTDMWLRVAKEFELGIFPKASLSTGFIPRPGPSSLPSTALLWRRSTRN